MVSLQNCFCVIGQKSNGEDDFVASVVSQENKVEALSAEKNIISF